MVEVVVAKVDVEEWRIVVDTRHASFRVKSKGSLVVFVVVLLRNSYAYVIAMLM